MVNEAWGPTEFSGLAMGGLFLSGSLVYGIRASLQETAFKVGLVVGAVGGLYVELTIPYGEEQEYIRGISLFTSGFASPMVSSVILFARKFFSSLGFKVRETSWRNVSFIAGLSVGYTTVSSLYHLYKLRKED